MAGGRKVELVVFDVDGVLVPFESSWRYVHERLGTLERAAIYRRMFLEGRITYYQWMFLDTLEWVLRFNGRLRKEVLERLFEGLRVDEEMRGVVMELKRGGRRVALLSSGVDLLVRRVAEEVSADHWLSNVLIFDDEGYLVPGGIPLVPNDRKGEVLTELRGLLGVSREATAFVSDSELDSSAFAAAGLSVAYGDKVPPRLACARALTPRQVIDAVRMYELGLLVCDAK